ncbi:MAG: hypothetical protein IMW83_06095 [Caldanaerobacter subterraneus]|nr:hypothetical protein [Caldanaerobacter subterraneus]
MEPILMKKEILKQNEVNTIMENSSQVAPDGVGFGCVGFGVICIGPIGIICTPSIPSPPKGN